LKFAAEEVFNLMKIDGFDEMDVFVCDFRDS
jgi:hypothetical protein